MMTYRIKYSTLFTERWMIMPKTTRNKNNIKHVTIELVLLLLLQKEQKYGYQLSQELSEFSEGKYELKETTMYPTLYRLTQNGYLSFEQVKVGIKRTRVYYLITDAGREYLQKIIDEYNTITQAISLIMQKTGTISWLKSDF